MDLRPVTEPTSVEESTEVEFFGGPNDGKKIVVPGVGSMRYLKVPTYKVPTYEVPRYKGINYYDPLNHTVGLRLSVFEYKIEKFCFKYVDPNGQGIKLLIRYYGYPTLMKDQIETIADFVIDEAIRKTTYNAER